MHTQTHNHFTAIWILSGTTWVSQYQKKYSSTHTYRGHQSSLICYLHLLRSIPSSLFNLHAWQSFSTISLQVFFGQPLGRYPPLHTPYISSPNHCLLFTTHAHTIATCFVVVPKLCGRLCCRRRIATSILTHQLWQRYNYDTTMTLSVLQMLYLCSPSYEFSGAKWR